VAHWHLAFAFGIWCWCDWHLAFGIWHWCDWHLGATQGRGGLGLQGRPRPRRPSQSGPEDISRGSCKKRSEEERGARAGRHTRGTRHLTRGMGRSHGKNLTPSPICHSQGTTFSAVAKQKTAQTHGKRAGGSGPRGEVTMAFLTSAPL